MSYQIERGRGHDRRLEHNALVPTTPRRATQAWVGQDEQKVPRRAGRVGLEGLEIYFRRPTAQPTVATRETPVGVWP